MQSEKIKTLVRYAEAIKSKMSEPTPLKHVGHPVEYKQYLTWELRGTLAQIDLLRDGGK